MFFSFFSMWTFDYSLGWSNNPWSIRYNCHRPEGDTWMDDGILVCPLCHRNYQVDLPHGCNEPVWIEVCQMNRCARADRRLYRAIRQLKALEWQQFAEFNGFANPEEHIKIENHNLFVSGELMLANLKDILSQGCPVSKSQQLDIILMLCKHLVPKREYEQLWYQLKSRLTQNIT
jgi:hypothetical protein